MYDEAFRQAILEAPDDDAPRLVYADWLDDHGDPARAEFIRVQCRLARLSAGAPDQASLVERERALLQEHGCAWAEPLRELNWSWRFRRGFIEALQIHPFQREAVEALARVTAFCPVRLLSIPDDCPEGEALVEAAPFLTRLRELRFEYTNFDGLSAHVQTLLTSVHLTGLTHLYVMGGRNWYWLNKKALRAIIASPSLTGLTDLTLVHDWRGLSEDLIRTLARSPRRARLQRLNLAYSRLEPEVMRELGASPHLARLTHLDFRGCDWRRSTWEVLLEPGLFPSLQRLYLYNTDVCDADTRHIADVGESILGRDHWRPDEPLREELVARFGRHVIDFHSEDDHRHWEGWETWEGR